MIVMAQIANTEETVAGPISCTVFGTQSIGLDVAAENLAYLMEQLFKEGFKQAKAAGMKRPKTVSASHQVTLLGSELLVSVVAVIHEGPLRDDQPTTVGAGGGGE